MDSGVIKPVSALAQAVTSQAQYAMRSAAANETELPAEQVVTPATESDGSARSRAEAERRDDRPLKRENYFDQETDTLIFRATDPSTGEVVRQIPEEALLRLRQALASQTATNIPAAGAQASIGTGSSEPTVSRTL
ncbi:FlaG protein [Breoghania corrubedonensis]|uniref:FlaG protein n=1 Tax=Breoghania corrubedonensis TaxID=665038 RepID=A0A2T5VDH5_9HYPH|nr:flagellar protein FlaG [Breoghania corrubedonensis]PTW61784.1 FlaG protein [Breoghania corrubedonensis]